MHWWVTALGQDPVGPVSTELVLRGIEAGRVPKDALVCEVGGKQWQAIDRVPPFAGAFEKTPSPQKTFDPNSEQTLFDMQPLRDTEPPPEGPVRPSVLPLEAFDDSAEHTIVDVIPSPPAKAPPLRAPLSRPSDNEERTIADLEPLESDPPR